MSMESLRPECERSDGKRPSILGLSALRSILRSINKRRGLIRGALDKGDRHCALGCFWADHPRTAVETRICEMVASVNDSLSDRAKPKTRWRKVQRWLQNEIEMMTASDRGAKHD